MKRIVLILILSIIAFQTTTATTSRAKFSPEEDSIIISLAHYHGPNDWNFIASQMLNEAGEQTRTTRQCRDRWCHYLSPSINSKIWLLEQDKLLLEKHRIFGKKWTRIAQHLSTKTEFDIRNRCLYLLKPQTNSRQADTENFILDYFPTSFEFPLDDDNDPNKSFWNLIDDPRFVIFMSSTASLDIEKSNSLDLRSDSVANHY